MQIKEWNPKSWRIKTALQQPNYKDLSALEEAEKQFLRERQEALKRIWQKSPKARRFCFKGAIAPKVLQTLMLLGFGIYLKLFCKWLWF